MNFRLWHYFISVWSTLTPRLTYLSHLPAVVLAEAEAEKKRKYCNACTKRHATFTPLCFSVDGFVGDETACFLKHLAIRLYVTCEYHYGEVIRWWWAQLAFALV